MAMRDRLQIMINKKAEIKTGREKEFDFYWGRGKTVNNPEEKKRKGNTTMAMRDRLQIMINKKSRNKDGKRERVRFLLGKGKNCK